MQKKKNKKPKVYTEPKAKNSKAAWGKLLRFARPWYVETALSFTLAMIAAVLMLLGPDRIGNMVEYIIMGYHPGVIRTGTFLIAIFGIMALSAYASNWIMVGVAQDISRKLRKRISQKLNKLPLSYYDKTQTGDVLSHVTNDVDTVSMTLNYALVTIFASVTQLIGAIIFMFIAHWLLAIVAIVSSFLGFIGVAIIVARSQKYHVAGQKQLGELNGHIEESFSGHTVIKASNAQKQVGKKFNDLNKGLYTNEYKGQFYGGLMMPIMMFMGQFSFLAICVVGGALAFRDPTLFPIIASFMLYVRVFSSPLADIAESTSHLQRTAASSERVFKLLDQTELGDEKYLRPLDLSEIKGKVSFENVKFGYVPEKTIINNFSAEIKSGSKVAIVGPTGAGKTTLVNLLMKFYQIDEGDIKIDDISINEMTRENVASLFAMVLQDTWLFEGSIRQNLIYNMKIPEEKEDELLEQVTKTVGIDHFIKTLPNGIDTILDDKQDVSTGQRQLLTIARAMLKNAPLLILDEATSSVDTRTEVLIQEAMDKLTKNHTSFVIAHRLSTIKNADTILVIDKGDIVESGDHNTLLKKGGFYANLYNSQFATA
ncbi:MAG: ABC transporter ATP-binding protein/permease [Firmicutes bacterium]|nr:ABC transporter ATP-binding protein/permease [Bacillota bacterium]